VDRLGRQASRVPLQTVFCLQPVGGEEVKHVKYLHYVLRHKWYVFVECCKMGIPWRGVVHDMSKLRPSEFFPYAQFFYGKGSVGRRARDKTGYYKPTDTGDRTFDFAWLLHQKRNDHHWQWWILPEDGGGTKVLPMSDAARKEMLCDWRGAGRAQGWGGNTVIWYAKNKDKMSFHPDTRAWIEAQRGVLK
jgi:hypothetical protein